MPTLPINKLKKEFQNPGVEYRGAPFWSWNDKLDIEELKWQVRDMKARGLGGFFMHSREGLETEYLGVEWMECVREVVKEAKKTGMLAFLYDEDRWPSGFAGGLVPAQGGDECKAKGLVLEVKSGMEYQPEPNDQCIFLAQLADQRLLKLKRITGQKEIKPAKDEVILVFKLKISMDNKWYNNGPYGDNLSPVSVRKFIETTYEAYKQEVGAEFGRTIPSIFTDEPNIADYRGTGEKERWIPWTTIFADFFRKQRGYDILDKIPHFFFESKESLKTRHDYWKTITELYVSSFSRQLGEWCQKNKIAFTGHYLYEQDLFGQIAYGGAIMPHYEYQQEPGIDILTESIHETLTVKQCSSVAHQFNRERVLSELYGCTGWDFTFEGQKWSGDWQYVLGVNFRCQHLTLYTLRGCAKRDYPASINYQSTYWKYYNLVEDYFARLSLVLRQGEPIREILLIHPVASAWAMHDFSNRSPVEKIDQRFKKLSDNLLALHHDHDYGDELLIEKYGQVKGKEFVINQASYKLVIIPPCLTLSSSTIKLLNAFLRAGGQVIAIKPLPYLVDAQPSDQIIRLLKHRNVTVVNELSEIKTALDQIRTPRIMIQNDLGQEIESIFYMERQVGNQRFLFLVNTDRTRGFDAKISLIGRGGIEEWDSLNGGNKAIPSWTKGGYLRFDVHLGPAGSRLYAIDPKAKTKVSPAKPLIPSGAEYLGPVWKHQRTHPNALPLDFCEYSLNGRPFSQRLPVWQAQREVRDQLGLIPIEHNGICQRWKWLKDKKEVSNSETVFRFGFRVKDKPATPLYLILESPQYFSIKLNDQDVPHQPDGWYIDKSFIRFKLPEVKTGENILTLTCQYKNEMQVEDCYLVGDFGVDHHSLEIMTEPKELHTGDWCLQRYPFYAGSMLYQATQKMSLPPKGEKVFLKLSEYRASVIRVKVNDQVAGFIPWRAMDPIEITPLIRAGENVFEIEVVGSPRNLLGPFHYKAGKPPYVGPTVFRTQAKEFTPDYILAPYGIMGQVTLERFKYINESELSSHKTLT